MYCTVKPAMTGSMETIGAENMAVIDATGKASVSGLHEPAGMHMLNKTCASLCCRLAVSMLARTVRKRTRESPCLR